MEVSQVSPSQKHFWQPRFREMGWGGSEAVLCCWYTAAESQGAVNTVVVYGCPTTLNPCLARKGIYIREEEECEERALASQQLAIFFFAHRFFSIPTLSFRLVSFVRSIVYFTLNESKLARNIS